MLNEATIIQSLKKAFPAQTPHAIGDDGAVLPLSNKHSYIITKDLLIEEIHFRLAYVDAINLGYKALHVNLSDIAAMGATPKYVLLGISIPEHYEGYLCDFLQSFTKACHEAQVTLIGGDTIRSPDKLFISITAIGIADNKYIKTRHTATPGDIICVAGNLGYAHLGFQAFEQSVKNLNTFKTAFLQPTALIQEGLWLGRQKAVHAMMDISDGLYIDLKKLLDASCLSADIHLDNLNYTTEFETACKTLKLDPHTAMLTGGEDYGLLFTIDANAYEKFVLNFYNQFAYSLKVIGRIIKKEKGKGSIQFTKNRKKIALALHPFSHFNEL